MFLVTYKINILQNANDDLKYFEKEVYSRRVNHKDRLIYTIYESIKEIDISSCVGHYG